MICSQCKNEKWNQDICPNCGLSEKDALLVKAENSRKNGNNLLAAEAYKKYILIQSDDINAIQNMAIVLCLEALSKYDENVFEKADQALRLALSKEWLWERGHELRVNIFSSYGKLKALEEEYQLVGLNDDFRSDICKKIIKTIQLTQKFSNTPPKVNTSLTSQSEIFDILKNYWVLLFLPLLLWGISKVPMLNQAHEEKNFYTVLFFVTIAVISISIILSIVIIVQRRKKAGKNEKNQD